MNLGAKEIRIFSRDEKKQDSMRRRFNSETIKFYLGDVRDEQSLKRSMNGVDFIFHAAALKQVPSCEFFPQEAIKTNILGTENVIRQAMNANVKKVVCLSSDKAVYPVNAMGLTKLDGKTCYIKSVLLGSHSDGCLWHSIWKCIVIKRIGGSFIYCAN